MKSRKIWNTNCILLVLITFQSVCLINAQNKEAGLNNGFGFGFNVNQYQNDFGMGLNVTSPYFANDQVAIRIKGNLMFTENIKDSVTRWTPYAQFSMGIVGIGGMVGESTRIYGEGGMVALNASDEISSAGLVLGGYGLLGFEFFANSSLNYFIEIGGIGTGARADRLINKPMYSNGFLIGAGLRINLK